MTTISDIPRDLIEEILSRVSITSIRAVRSTCKRWDALSKDHSFTKKHCGLAAKEFMMGIMTYDIRDCLTNVNLHGIYNHKDGLFDSSIKQLDYHHRCVTLKGNTYFVAFARGEVDLGYFLVCFDFTRERFGPRLRLPFHSCGPDSVIISTVREEQLGVLFKKAAVYMIEIWVTTYN
ncbi:putative F-box protein At5g51000 [Eutrema salsugineum]|uniref:putative F-box protein At5g51000 n=1 Tax=Eutrema salsugineum TaxID=72664 RepID=UPI000CED393F|nr:putative F-box protein At5g51000 [Eutrema salsugineum]